MIKGFENKIWRLLETKEGFDLLLKGFKKDNRKKEEVKEDNKFIEYREAFKLFVDKESLLIKKLLFNYASYLSHRRDNIGGGDFGETGKYYSVFTRDLGMIYASAQRCTKDVFKIAICFTGFCLSED